MAKTTIKEELTKRDYKSPSKFMTFVYHTITNIIGKPYHCEYNIIDDINEEKGPAIILFNHLSRFDHIFINQITYPRRINIVAAHNEFYRGSQYLLFKLDRVIPKRNFVIDLTAMRAVKKVLNEGGTICLAPEGMTPMDGKNTPVKPGTGSLLKAYKVPVYFIQLQGQFMIASKVCLDERRGGKCSASIRKIFTPEALDSLSAEEIENNLNNMLKHDEFDWQKEHHYKYDLKGESCKNLHDLLFYCPKCGEMFTMEGKGNHLVCKNCGNGLEMDDYYDFHPYENSVIPENPSKWVDIERKKIIQDIRKDPHYSFTMHVKLGKLPLYKPTKHNATSELCGEGTMVFDHSGVHFEGIKDNQEFKFDQSYNDLYTIMSALDYSFFDFYVNGDYYDFFPVAGEEGKIGYLQLLVEEMHRLHVNKYKNFEWFNDLYEDSEIKK